MKGKMEGTLKSPTSIKLEIKTYLYTSINCWILNSVLNIKNFMISDVDTKLCCLK